MKETTAVWALSHFPLKITWVDWQGSDFGWTDDDDRATVPHASSFTLALCGEIVIVSQTTAVCEGNTQAHG